MPPTVIGGKLKLKGDKPEKKGKKRSHDEMKEGEEAGAASSSSSSTTSSASSSSSSLASAGAPSTKEAKTLVDEYAGMTDAQRKHLKRTQDLDVKRAKELAKTTYRQRVDAMNHYLATLTEHNDIPRVSAAGNG